MDSREENRFDGEKEEETNKYKSIIFFKLLLVFRFY